MNFRAKPICPKTEHIGRRIEIASETIHENLW